MKLLLILLLIIGFISLPKIIIYFLNNGNPYDKTVVTKHVPAYLEKQGYTDSDIAEQRYLEPKHTINRKVLHGHYVVIFKDEPGLEYYYGVTKFRKKVVQFCGKEDQSGELITEKTKHSEKDCLDQFANK
ncbi:DUF3139 domain-containing protein [Sporosarcina cyprini]|uniref:DUF3139 domain-containing protein n=1 Tax=Sporosarcina cyprini TaxID=2910523 RepID=UPI001EDE3650|nr:DUF3139 domain-containing protein [Sporosarcina cyprini]MCG3087465.1 DUF3139 domain-containing protein [Sporosarcina cyprini]